MRSNAGRMLYFAANDSCWWLIVDKGRLLAECECWLLRLEEVLPFFVFFFDGIFHRVFKTQIKKRVGLWQKNMKTACNTFLKSHRYPLGSSIQVVSSTVEQQLQLQLHQMNYNLWRPRFKSLQRQVTLTVVHQRKVKVHVKASLCPPKREAIN